MYRHLDTGEHRGSDSVGNLQGEPNLVGFAKHNYFQLAICGALCFLNAAHDNGLDPTVLDYPRGSTNPFQFTDTSAYATARYDYTLSENGRTCGVLEAKMKKAGEPAFQPFEKKMEGYERWHTSDNKIAVQTKERPVVPESLVDWVSLSGVFVSQL